MQLTPIIILAHI